MVGKIIEFTTVSEDDGSLTFFEQSREIPFIIKRCFYVYDVPAEKQRADHASTTTDFVLIAINGGVKVELDDGVKKVCYSLTNRVQGLLVPKDTWMKVGNFTKGAILLVLASTEYKEGNYIKKYSEFKDHIGKK